MPLVIRMGFYALIGKLMKGAPPITVRVATYCTEERLSACCCRKK